MSGRHRRNRTPGVSSGLPTGRGAVQARSVMASGAWDGARSDLKEMRNFNPRNGGPLSDNLGDLTTLRARARDLLRNAPLASGARQTVQMGVIGEGLGIYPRVMRGVLERRQGLTTEEMDDFERDAAELWWAWSDSTACDIRRERRFRAITGQTFSSAWTDGDMCVVRRHKPRPGDVLSLKLQLIEADRLSTPTNEMYNPRIIDGVEHDEDGAPLAYYFEDANPGDRMLSPGVRTWKRVPAFGPDGERAVLHIRNLSTEDRIGAVRAIPALAPVIVLLKQLSRYSDAELMRNIVASMITAFIETPADSAQGGDSGLAPIDANDTSRLEGYEYKLGTGAVVELTGGKKMNLTQIPGPSSAFDPFTTALMRQMGAAINIPFEVLVRHFTSSYSAARAAVNFAYEAFAIMRGWMEDDFVAPVWGWFLYEAIGAGMLQAPGFFTDPLARKAYCNIRLTGPVAPQLDPLKEAVAAGERMDILLSTHEEETAKVTGGDWGDNLPQLAKERKQIVEAGLDIEQQAERVRVAPVAPLAPDAPIDPTKTNDGAREDTDDEARDDDAPETAVRRTAVVRAARRTARRPLIASLLTEER